MGDLGLTYPIHGFTEKTKCLLPHCIALGPKMVNVKRIRMARKNHTYHSQKTTYITDLKTYFRDTSKYISPIYILKVRHSKTDLNFVIPSAQHQRGEIARGSRL